MALKKIENGHYIKFEPDGTFKIYKSQKERTQEKKATPFERICLKYTAKINSLTKDLERHYYDPAFAKTIAAWQMEFEKYLRMHSQGLKSKDFPLMKQLVKDIEKSLPEIICVGQVGVENSTLPEVYAEAKNKLWFSEVEDC